MAITPPLPVLAATPPPVQLNHVSIVKVGEPRFRALPNVTNWFVPLNDKAPNAPLGAITAATITAKKGNLPLPALQALLIPVAPVSHPCVCIDSIQICFFEFCIIRASSYRRIVQTPQNESKQFASVEAMASSANARRASLR